MLAIHSLKQTNKQKKKDNWNRRKCIKTFTSNIYRSRIEISLSKSVCLSVRWIFGLCCFLWLYSKYSNTKNWQVKFWIKPNASKCCEVELVWRIPKLDHFFISISISILFLVLQLSERFELHWLVLETHGLYVSFDNIFSKNKRL